MGGQGDTEGVGCADCRAGNPPSNWRAGENYVPDTNADRIRAMSDEELALFQAKRYAQSVFLDKEKDGVVLTGAAKEAFIADLYHVWLRYLKQPAEED